MYCTGCCLIVADADPERFSLGDGEVWHKGCLTKKLKTLTPYQVRPEYDDKQLTLFVY